jgi:hypothetical protein
MPNPVYNVSDPEGDPIVNNEINIAMFSEETNTDEEIVNQVLSFTSGWCMFSTLIDVDKSAADQVGSFTQPNSFNTPLYNAIDVVLVGAGLDIKADGSSGNIIIVKNYLGSAYLPEYDFNGIGTMINGEGYAVKMEENI